MVYQSNYQLEQFGLSLIKIQSKMSSGTREEATRRYKFLTDQLDPVFKTLTKIDTTQMIYPQLDKQNISIFHNPIEPLGQTLLIQNQGGPCGNYARILFSHQNLFIRSCHSRDVLNHVNTFITESHSFTTIKIPHTTYGVPYMKKPLEAFDT